MSGWPVTLESNEGPAERLSGHAATPDDFLSELDPKDSRPPSKQIAQQLRSAILSGQLKEYTRLPSQSQLSMRYGVARETIKAALRQLAAENLISSRQGSRSVVRPRTSYEELHQSSPSACEANTFTELLEGIQEAHDKASSTIQAALGSRQAFFYATQLAEKSLEMARAAEGLRNQTAIKIAEHVQRDIKSLHDPEGLEDR